MWCMHNWTRVSLLFVLHTFSGWAQAHALDCQGFPCTAPYTQTPFGSPCGCVFPMQIQLDLNVTLEALFPQVSFLTDEIANGLLLLRSQVRVVGAIADGQDQGRSLVKLDLVPLGKSFDNLTAVMIFQRLWNHQVLESTPYFSNYMLVSVHYPGLTSSSTSAHTNNNTSAELPGAELWPLEQPLSVDVPKEGRRLGGGTLALISLSSTVAVVACGVLLLLFLRFNKLVTTFRGAGKSRNFLCELNSLSSSRVATSTLAARIFSFYDLERATDNFNADNVVGQGGYGQVFAGMLEDGTEVAIKLMIRDNEQKNDVFFAELEMLSRVHHKNLVKLIGACLEENRCCLVYEFIPNGNVESHLHGSNKLVQPLDWNARMKIALGAARGLAYLHEDANPRVIHWDFKASNILLESDFTPKISDFGLAKTADKEDGQTSVMGTFGYLAPEYAMSGHLLVKSDVYCFGVVLLELLSGKRPIDLSQPSGKENLVNWARPLLSSEEGLEALADPSLEGRFPLDVFSKVAAIASMCVQPDFPSRPFMGEVVQALKVVCCTSEGLSSLSVSPQASGSGQASDTKSGPLIDIDDDSPTSVDFGFNTAPKRVKEAQESFTTRLSDSGYNQQHLFDSSERHSLSGPSSSNGTMYVWSMERDNAFALASEHRVFWNKERKCPSTSSGAVYSWSIERDNAFASNSEHRVFWNKENSVKAEARGSWP